LPARRKASRHAAVIEPAERARARAGLNLRRGCVKPGAAVEPGAAGAAVEPSAAVEFGAAVKSGVAVEPGAAAVEMVAVDERATVRHVPVVIEVDRPVAPVCVPVVPSPTEARE